jgi:hypothetical protein
METKLILKMGQIGIIFLISCFHLCSSKPTVYKIDENCPIDHHCDLSMTIIPNRTYRNDQACIEISDNSALTALADFDSVSVLYLVWTDTFFINKQIYALNNFEKIDIIADFANSDIMDHNSCETALIRTKIKKYVVIQFVFRGRMGLASNYVDYLILDITNPNKIKKWITESETISLNSFRDDNCDGILELHRISKNAKILE